MSVVRVVVQVQFSSLASFHFVSEENRFFLPDGFKTSYLEKQDKRLDQISSC